MDIQKEKEAFEAWFESRYGAHFMQFALDLDFYVDKHTQTCWEAWQAKAQAVPEGFVLVKKVHPDAIVHNQGLGLFKECQVIYGWDGKSKDFKEALNKGFYHGVKLGAKAVLETAMIEAQEPANEL